jgi:hypothetical protein
MTALLMAAFLTTIGVQAPQAKPLRTPEKRVAEGKPSLDTQYPTSAEQQQHPAANVTAICQQPNNTDSSGTTNKQEQAQANENLRIQWILTLFTGLLVLVGFLQAITLIWQAVVFSRQTKATEKAAKAAKDSADGLVNSERAWIVVENAAAENPSFGKLAARPFIMNSGKTIARIKRISLGGGRPRQIGEKLPEIPEYEGFWDFDFVLVPGREFPSDGAPSVPINMENWFAIENRTLKLYLYGLIEYLDLAGNERVTGFCLIREPSSGFHPYLGAPKAYNRAT